ncbi:MAG: hypothetical protein BIFFINMI_03653 [Phycisphaerae bacterium]|nr:hypothetical protein [Phycisphaerae bacterium]
MKLESIFDVDRRFVFVGIFLALLIPMLVPYPLPCKPNKDVENMYIGIDDAISRGKKIFLSFEYDPTGAAEQEPMARAVMRHIFSRGGKAVIMCKSGGQQGQEMHQQLLADCAQEYGRSYGADYCYLPYKPGSTNLVINLGQSLRSTWPQDVGGTDLADLEVTRDVQRLADFGYVMIICSSLTTVVDWLTYGQGPYNLNMGFGVLGNVTPDVANYTNSGQIKGLLGGLIGAAQYEQILLDKGINLMRRFSPADLASAHMVSFCSRLSDPEADGLGRYVWDALSPATQAAVRDVIKEGYDNLNAAAKTDIAAALNRVIMRTDVIPDAELSKAKPGHQVASLLDGQLKERAPQILRRLIVEKEFGKALVAAQSAGQAMTWMTPQSIAHVVLIVAILFGNACYLYDRARRKKHSQI